MKTKRVALVTGANRGIGLEVCRQLAADENHTVILSARNGDAGHEAIEKLRKDGLKVDFLELDVESAARINHALIRIKEKYGRLDVLINNAGVYLDEGARLCDVDEQVIRTTLQTNLWGALRLCRAFIPLMVENSYGRIVNVSSGLGALGRMRSGTGAYKISKLALNGLTQILADEVNTHHVKINAVCPGWVRTDMGGSAAPTSVEKAASGIVWAATLPENGPSGGFFRHGKTIAW